MSRPPARSRPLDARARDQATALAISDRPAAVTSALAAAAADRPDAARRDPARRGSPGSYLVICHACRDVRPDTADNATTVYNSRVAANLRVRTRDEIAALFDGFTLVEPGLVWIPEWRPDSPADVPENPEQFWALVGVARRDA